MFTPTQVKIYCDHLQTDFNYKCKTQGELPKQCGVRSKKGRISLRRACSWSSGGFAPIFSTLSSSLWCHFVVEVNLIIDITYFKFWLLCCHFNDIFEIYMIFSFKWWYRFYFWDHSLILYEFHIIYYLSSWYPYDRLFNTTKNHCSFTTYAIVMEFVWICT